MKDKIFPQLISHFVTDRERVRTAGGHTIILRDDYTWEIDYYDTGSFTEFDFKVSKNQVECGIKPKIKITLLDGDDNPTKVYFTFKSSAKEFEIISITKIKNLIAHASTSIMDYLKNRYSFIPKDINISFDSSKKNWVVIFIFLSKNAVGGEVVTTETMYYDQNIENFIEFKKHEKDEYELKLDAIKEKFFK